MVYEKFLKIGEYAASGAFEEPERSLFYRKALGIRRFYENCPLCEYRGERLYPSGVFYSGSAMVAEPTKGHATRPLKRNQRRE